MDVPENSRVVMGWLGIIKITVVLDWHFEVLTLVKSLGDVSVLIWWVGDFDVWVKAWPQGALEVLATSLDFVTSVTIYDDLLLNLRTFLTDKSADVSRAIDRR